jgi:hypothetical protein
MKTGEKLIVEVMYKPRYCLICQYMDEAVLEVLPGYDDFLEYRRVDILENGGKEPFLELSVALFGEKGVYREMRIAPVPSMFVDGELVFDSIPSKPLLEETFEEIIAEHFQSGAR